MASLPVHLHSINVAYVYLQYMRMYSLTYMLVREREQVTGRMKRLSRACSALRTRGACQTQQLVQGGVFAAPGCSGITTPTHPPTLPRHLTPT
jgi:hypothetical protein